MNVQELAKQIREQDNAGTADPIYIVQRREREGPVDGDFFAGEVVYVTTFDHVEYTEAKTFQESVNEARDAGDLYLFEEEEEDDHPKMTIGGKLNAADWLNKSSDDVTPEEAYVAEHTNVYVFVTKWRDEQPFFTRAEAERYCGNSKDLRIWVGSAHKNREWQFIRNLILELGDDSN